MQNDAAGSPNMRSVRSTAGLRISWPISRNSAVKLSFTPRLKVGEGGMNRQSRTGAAISPPTATAPNGLGNQRISVMKDMAPAPKPPTLPMVKLAPSFPS